MFARTPIGERPGMSEQGDEPPRLPLADAATKLGKSQEAVRAMIRRGKLATIRGNDGRLLVTVPPELVRADVALNRGRRAAPMGIGRAAGGRR
jgi:hypothetical protein